MINRNVVRSIGDTILVVFIIPQVCVFVWSLVGGIFIWAGYRTLEMSFIFATTITFISVVSATPAFLAPSKFYKFVEAYLLAGGVTGGVAVLAIGIFCSFARLFSTGPEEMVVLPQFLALIVAIVALGAAVLAFLSEVESRIAHRRPVKFIF